MSAPYLPELLATLSLSTDLANGLPAETALRSAVLASNLGRALGLTGAVLDEVYVTSLLRFIGCTAYAHEEAALVGGDDLGLRRAFKAVDPGRPAEVARMALEEVGRGKGALARGRQLVHAALHASPTARAHAGCDVARQLGERLGASAGVIAGLTQL